MKLKCVFEVSEKLKTYIARSEAVLADRIVLLHAVLWSALGMILSSVCL